jgi:hypothetical protein
VVQETRTLALATSQSSIALSTLSLCPWYLRASHCEITAWLTRASCPTCTWLSLLVFMSLDTRTTMSVSSCSDAGAPLAAALGATFEVDLAFAGESFDEALCLGLGLAFDDDDAALGLGLCCFFPPGLGLLPLLPLPLGGIFGESFSGARFLRGDAGIPKKGAP